jgi:hypothetical protein
LAREDLSKIPDGLYGMVGDEMTECSIYDATSQKERTDITYKKQRKVYKDKSIRVRFKIRNTLLNDFHISNLRLCCRYVDTPSTE